VIVRKCESNCKSSWGDHCLAGFAARVLVRGAAQLLELSAMHHQSALRRLSGHFRDKKCF
jgi:hypothetical protein